MVDDRSDEKMFERLESPRLDTSYDLTGTRP